MLDLITQLTTLSISFLAGFIGSLTGIGGGVIIVPVLTILFNLPIKEAIAISIVTVIATSISGGSSYVEQRITNIRLAVFLETSTVLGALIGATLLLIVRGEYLYIVFSSLATYLALSQLVSTRMEIRKMKEMGFSIVDQDKISKYLQLEGEYYDESINKKISYKVKNSILGWIVSLFAGLGSGLLGIGGGVFKVSVMNVHMNIPIKVAVATSKFMIGVTASTSAIIYLLNGLLNPFNLSYIAPAALGTILGATVGTRIMNKLRIRLLKIVFGILMLYIAYSMLSKGLLAILGVKLPP